MSKINNSQYSSIRQPELPKKGECLTLILVFFSVLCNFINFKNYMGFKTRNPLKD